MDKEKKELILAPILVIIAILFVLSTVKKVMRSFPQRKVGMPSPAVIDKSKLQKHTPVPLSPPRFEKVVPSEINAAPAEEAKFDIDTIDWGRDPFTFDLALLFSSDKDQGHLAKLEQLSRLKLTGMIISKDNPKDSIAVINGENLKVGEMISGFILKEVKTNSVVLAWDSEEFTLMLWEEESQKKER
ncbi:MAG: hypothetical protein AB1629_02865 [Candidatus Omnitrophota bacterium]